MRKGIELSQRATEAARRASTQSSAISSDDPDAIAKLKEKLAGLEQSQATMKATNKLLRKGDIAGLPELVGENKAEALQRPDFAGRTGYPGYMLTNNNANIRSTKQRIAELEARGDMEQAEDRQGDGYVIREDVADNRLLFIFDEKPPAETRAILKSNGFRWSPSRMAWVRKLSGNARYVAECVASQLGQKGTER